jgi:hypothetical protein
VYDRLDVQPAASVACTVKEKTPTDVGVPARAPAELRLKPGGREPLVRAKE